MKSFGHCRSFSTAFLAILSISEIALSFRLSIRRTPLYGYMSKFSQSAGLSTYIHQETMMRKTYLCAVITESKGRRGRRLMNPIFRRLKWFVTLLRHIVQLIVRSFANIDREEKNSDVERRSLHISEADDDVPEVNVSGLAVAERENVQRIVKAEPRLTSSYVNHERQEADKSYAERKLQEIATLQIEAQNSRMARKAKAERDEVWAQSSLNKSEKRVYTDGDGDNEGGISLDGDDDKERGRDSVEESGSSPSVGGKADRTDASNISKVKDAIKNMKATNKEIIKSTSEVEEEKNFKQAKKEKEAVPTPEGGAGAGAEAPSKFSSKPNLSVILKKSLKDSLYSINVNGFYSNNGSAFAETKNSDMIPLVRNSLLLSEKIDFEKKMGSKKSISAIGNDNALTLDPTVETSDGEEIKKGDGHGEEHEAGDVESLRVAGDEISKLKSEVVGLQKQESSLLANNEYLLPPALQPDRAAQADEGGMSPPPTYRTGARALGESAAVASQAGSDFRTVEIAERSAASMFGERAELRQGLEEDSGRQVPDYAEESIERLVQKQQAEEYENEFLDPSSTSPSAAITGLPQSFAVLLPSSSFSSPSDDSYPLNPPLSLLGEWELAEQRYLTSDRSSLSDFYMDTISFPSFGSLSSSLSGSKGTEWVTKKRSKEESREGEEGEDLEVFDLPHSDADSEGYEVEFNVIRGCSSTEWMKGQGRHEKTITARIIKPPKEAYEQRPTLCTYTGVLTSPNSIRGYVYSTAMTIEGERQLVGLCTDQVSASLKPVDSRTRYPTPRNLHLSIPVYTDCCTLRLEHLIV